MTQANKIGPFNTMQYGSLVGWIAFTITALGAIFYLPELFPVDPSISDSYFFGYNNRVGVLLLLFFLGVGGIFSSRLNLDFRSTLHAVPLPRRMVWQWMMVFAAGSGLMYLFVHGLDGFEDSAYLIDRVKMSAEGKVPYRDFEFAYGALFLYGPRFLMYLHLSAEQGYYFFWFLNLLGGIWVLALCLDRLKYPSERRTEIFSLFCLFALPPLLVTGLNYTLFRFIPAIFFSLVVERRIALGGQRQKAIAMLMVLVFTALLLLISPEMGLAYAAGSLGYIAFFGVILPRDWKAAPLYALLALSEGALLWTADRLQVFATLKTFGNGAFNFPILPAGHILLFFFCCGFATLFVSSRLRSNSAGDGTLMVLAVSTPALFSALGRCDTAHVGFSGIGILLVATLLASAEPLIWRIYRPAFLVFLVVLPAISALCLYQAQISKVLVRKAFRVSSPEGARKLEGLVLPIMVRKYGAVDAKAKIELMRATSKLSSEVDVQSAYPGVTGTLEAPFGFSPNGFGTQHSKTIARGYFSGLINAFTPATVTMKITELKLHPERELLLPLGPEAPCQVDFGVEQRRIQILLAFPWHGKVKNKNSVWEPLCSYIQNNYHAIEKAGPQQYDYEIWKPTQSATVP